jgi:RimJ/RimL family protein N-acetyltransferase
MLIDKIATPPVTIDAGRFVLRPVRKSDAGLIAHYTADRRLAEGTRSIPNPLPPGAAEAYVAQAMRADTNEDIWVMDGSASGLPEVLGEISLRRMDDGKADRCQSQIGYWVAPAFWNTGIASEAVKALIAANPHGSKCLFAEVFQDNPGSAKVLIHNGFSYLGDAETYAVARAARVPTWTYMRKLG